MSSCVEVGIYSHSNVSKSNIYKSDVILRSVTSRPPWKWNKTGAAARQGAAYEEIHLGAYDGRRGTL